MSDQSPSLKRAAAFGAALAIFAAPAFAQDDGDSQQLARQLANPVSSLISVPFQLNYDSGFGPDDGARFLLNVQPVIPFSIGENWNLISRTIVPFNWADSDFPGGSAQAVGDTTQSFFFSPKAPTSGGLIWGAGPVFLLPTATDDTFGADQWGVGITGVVLRQSGPWTVGGLANHIWGVANNGDLPDINQTFLQPFVNYTTPKATGFFINTESTYNWQAEQWSVPINFGVTQVIKIGSQRAQIGGGLRYWAESPDGGPEGWGARLIFTLLFPKGRA